MKNLLISIFTLSVLLSLGCANKETRVDDIIRYSRKDKVVEDKPNGKLHGCWQPNSDAACRLPDCKNYVKLSEVKYREEISNDLCGKYKVIKIIVSGYVYPE
jgi:hypothetical protein